MGDVWQTLKDVVAAAPVLTALLGAASAPPLIAAGRWVRELVHARTPEGRAEAAAAREATREAEHWQTHDRSIAALARTRDQLIDDLARIRADRDHQAEQHRAEREVWAAERAALMEQHRLERESWAGERERILREVDHWETRFRAVLEEFETWKRLNGYPAIGDDPPPRRLS